MLGVGEFFIIASFLTAFLKRRQKNRRLNKFRMDETLFRYLFQFIIFLDHTPDYVFFKPNLLTGTCILRCV